MTIIKTSHAGCGDLELAPEALVLNVSVFRPDLSHYAFTCPLCLQAVTKPADSHVISLLTAGGTVSKTHWEPPLEVLEKRPGGDPISWDDVIGFCLHLGLGDDVARWAA